MEEVKEEKVSEPTKSKWSSFKKGLSNINDKFTKKMKPVSQKIAEGTAEVGKKYDESDNSVIKGFRGSSLLT